MIMNMWSSELFTEGGKGVPDYGFTVNWIEFYELRTLNITNKAEFFLRDYSKWNMILRVYGK
jgi:hypothetical protein